MYLCFQKPFRNTTSFHFTSHQNHLYINHVSSPPFLAKRTTEGNTIHDIAINTHFSLAVCPSVTPFQLMSQFIIVILSSNTIFQCSPRYKTDRISHQYSHTGNISFVSFVFVVGQHPYSGRGSLVIHALYHTQNKHKRRTSICIRTRDHSHKAAAETSQPPGSAALIYIYIYI